MDEIYTKPPDVVEVFVKLIFEKELNKISIVPLDEGKIVIAPPNVELVIILVILQFSNFI